MLFLGDKDIYPTDKVLEVALGLAYPILEQFVGVITNENYQLELQWKCYNEGKAWLAKVCYKGKTIFWLSIWDGYFKVSFHFTERTRDGVMGLDIDRNIKDAFSKTEVKGKLIGLIVDVKEEEQIDDLLQIISYKKGLK